MTFVDTNLTKVKKLVNQGSVSDAKLLLEEILSKFPNNIRAQNAINNLNINGFDENSKNHDQSIWDFQFLKKQQVVSQTQKQNEIETTKIRCKTQTLTYDASWRYRHKCCVF